MVYEGVTSTNFRTYGGRGDSKRRSEVEGTVSSKSRKKATTHGSQSFSPGIEFHFFLD